METTTFNTTNMFSQSIERTFVVRMGNCIRLYNASQADEKAKVQFERELKTFGDERRALEQQIGEKYQLNYYAYKKVVNDIYAEMNEADKGFVMGKGSPMWVRIDEFVTKFTNAIKTITEVKHESN